LRWRPAFSRGKTLREEDLNPGFRPSMGPAAEQRTTGGTAHGRWPIDPCL
jgi:hypothetical protein